MHTVFSPLARLLLTGLALLGVALPAPAQLELPRQFPTEDSFRAAIVAIRAGTHDGFEAFRGERRSEEEWDAVLMEGLTEDRAGDSVDSRHQVNARSIVHRYYLSYDFQRDHRPEPEVQAVMQADFATLRGWMLAEAGDWDFHLTTQDDGKRMARLSRPDGNALITLVFDSDPKDWWVLTLIASAPWVEPPPMPKLAAAGPGDGADWELPQPTEAGFAAVVEAMKAGAYKGLPLLKGVPASDEVRERHGGVVPVWSVMPMEGLAPDPGGERHALADYGRSSRGIGMVSATYRIASVERPDEEQRAELEESFRRMRGWLAARGDGWGLDETFYAWSYCTADSLCLKLVPLPGRPVERIDGEPLPRIELFLKKRTLDEPEGGEAWSLTLSCDAQGSVSRRPTKAPWALEQLAATDPAQELPAIPANFEEVVLALVAEAPNDFASLRDEELLPEFVWGDRVSLLEDPIFPITYPRRALGVHLMDAPDPDALRDCVVTFEERGRSEAYASLGLLSIAAPNLLTRHAVDARMEELAARLMERLDGWRLRIVELEGGKEDFNQRDATLDGLRPDGHPVWIQIERSSYPKDIPGQPRGDVLQLALYVGTNHEATVGEDLLARWNEALERGDEPLASGVRVLGDPLAGRLVAGDRVVAPGGIPIELLSLLGSSGQEEIVLDVIHERRYEQLAITPPRLSLERWDELRDEHDRGELSAAALSLLGTRLDAERPVELLRALVAAGERDFEGLSPELAARVDVSTVRALTTVSMPLWRGAVAPTTAFVDTLRAGLANAFDGDWIVEPYTRNTGPFWDWYARQTHWSARHEGPEGMLPWVELTESVRGGEVVVALEVRAFKSAHRLTNAEHPERLWFEAMAGDCADGDGVAWCHREGLSFDGPFVAGVPDGTGRHLYADGKEHTGVVYRAGRMENFGHVPPPPPPVRVISSARADYAVSQDDYLTLSNWSEKYGNLFDDSALYQSGVDFDQDFASYPVYRTCGYCGGDGWIDSKVWVDEYDYTPTSTSTNLWMRGYDAVETYKGSHYEYRSSECSVCFGTGSAAY